MLDLGFFANLETYGLIAIALVSLLIFVIGGQILYALLNGLGLDKPVSMILALIIIAFITIVLFSVLETVILSLWFWGLLFAGLIILFVIKKVSSTQIIRVY